jgi:glycosyltransferase involved in cell wall biosynthesis
MKINSQISNFKFQIPERFALYVGDVNWNKNLVNLAKAIQIANVPCVFVGKPFENLKNEKGEMKINSQISNFKFQIETHPWLQEFHSFLKIAKNSKNFISLGYVEDQHLIELYKRAVCNVLVSRDEGFGYSYAEAATQKCPSVLSDVDIFHETAGDAALFANPTDPSAIAEKMTQLFQDTKARNDLGEEAYQNTHSRFSPDIFRQSIIDLV